MKIYVPPIKNQGIKTKLVKWINSKANEVDFDRWVEPFMGSGVVAFNIRPKKALLCDSNPHLIRFYNLIEKEDITSSLVREFLTKEGQKLVESNGEYYYEVRDRFNDKKNSLDFLFLNRSCFNGMMRFNKKGGFNVPFCKKPNRFSKSLITKITNQVENIHNIIREGEYSFKNQDFNETLKTIKSNDLVYCDPPYIGRHVDYFDSWSEENEVLLKKGLTDNNVKFILSTWLTNKYRKNDYIFSLWNDCFLTIKRHFYFIGAKESNRNEIYEALLSNIKLENSFNTFEVKKLLESNNLHLICDSTKENKKNEQIVINFDLKK